MNRYITVLENSLLAFPNGYVCDMDVHMATRPSMIVNDATSAPISVEIKI